VRQSKAGKAFGVVVTIAQMLEHNLFRGLVDFPFNILNLQTVAIGEVRSPTEHLPVKSPQHTVRAPRQLNIVCRF
jgi:hypothetical protein